MNATLIPRAEALAKSASTAALACLDAAEEHERATLITRVAEPSRDRVDLWAAEVANRGATMDTLTNQYAELSKKIGTLIMAEQARKRSLWQRFLPNQKAMDTLAKLKTQRAALWESRREAEGPYLSAMAAQSRAEKDLARAEVETKRARTENAATARLRLTAVSRARRIMTAWPAYAYCGALRLLQAGVRIEDAKRNGWDNAREIPTNLAP
jgi:chromosome segregation ATPase